MPRAAPRGASTVLLQRWRNTYSYARLDREAETILRMPPGWGRWRRSVRRERPACNGFFDVANGMKYALYAADGRMLLRFDAVELPLGDGVRVLRERDGAEVVARMMDGDVELLSIPYRAPRRSRLDAKLDKYDLTPFRELMREDLFDMAASLTDDAQLEELAARWAAGLRF